MACGTTWGAPWGSTWGSCDPIDPVLVARGRARQRMLEDPVFDALVRIVGESIEEVEVDAWAMLHQISPTVATGAILEEWGENLGFPKPSLLWDSTRYRTVFGAWLVAQAGAKSIPKLLGLLAALADGETYSVSEVLPGYVVIDLIGVDGDRASIWAQVLEAARPKTVTFQINYVETSSAGWLLGTSELDIDTYLAGTIYLEG